MSDESYKQDYVDVARGYVDYLFHLGICGYSISAKLRFCRIAISHRYSSDVDDASIPEHLLKSAVGVTLIAHPKKDELFYSRIVLQNFGLSD